MRKVLLLLFILTNTKSYSQSFLETYNWIVEKVLKYGNCSVKESYNSTRKQWNVSINSEGLLAFTQTNAWLGN